MKTNFWKTAAVLLFGLAASATSCVDPNTQTPDSEPVFPEQVNKTVEPGKSCDIVIAPNLSWEVEISGDTEYFSLEFNGEPVPVASGKAGEYTLTVTSLSDESDFDQRQCTLTMTMAEKSEVIAVVNKNGKERLFSVYPVKIVDGEFEPGEESGYSFSETESSDLSMTYKEGDFLTFFKVVANFDWRLKEVPEWAEVNLFEGRYVDAAKANVPGVICLRGVNPKYPLDGDEGKLVFIIDDGSDTPAEVEKEITLSIEPVKNAFEVRQLSSNAEFNAAGDYYNEMAGGYIEGFPLRGYVSAVSGVRAYAVDCKTFTFVGSTDSALPVYSGWVNMQFTGEDETLVLQDLTFTAKVTENTGETRSAYIVIIPASVKLSDPESEILTDGFDGIREEYRQYVYATVTQEGSNGGIVEGAISADNGLLANKGARLDYFSIEDNGVGNFEEVFHVGVENYYKLTVTNPASAYYNLIFSHEVWNAEYYSIEWQGDVVVPVKLEETPSWFGSFTDQYIQLSFTEEDAFMQYFIVFQTEGNANFAVLAVEYNPEEVIGGGSSDALTFQYPDVAKGCSLRKMTEAEDGADSEGMFWQCAQNLYSPSGDYEIYELTYGPNCSQAFIESTLPYSGNWLLNETDATWLSCEVESGSPILVDMRDANGNYPSERKEGALIFVDRSQGYPMPQFAIVCVYDPTFE